MTFSNVIRNKVFWIYDAIKGGNIKKNFDDIQDGFGFSSFESLQKKNAPLLNELLSKAVDTTEFYAEYIGFKDLSDFPVVNKIIIKDNFDKINMKYGRESDVVSVSTSGSTGTPFKIYQSKGKKIRNTADTLFFAKTAGFNVGEKLLYLRLWAAYYKKTEIIAKLQNIEQIDVEDLTDEYIASLLMKLQNDKTPKGWLGYPSAYEKICTYLDKTNSSPIECNINSIIAMSEPLATEVKKKMEYYFGNPVVSRYSNVENGILAQQMPNEEDFTINWASYHVELLDIEKDVPVKNGEPGRIVITDLYNIATPMIRYDTGDVGVFTETGNDSKSPKFKVIQGRITDVLRNTRGEIVNPFVVYNNLYRYPELRQFQLVQKTNRNYVFKINNNGKKYDREEEMILFFKPFLGEDAEISIEYVEEIPLLKSGKRKIIVNLTNEQGV